MSQDERTLRPRTGGFGSGGVLAEGASYGGSSLKTLTRACTAAAGRTVKHVIDGRAALEARRLLAHTDEPVATIARRLGLPEPTDFGTFFTRHTGVTPGAVRQTHHNQLRP